MNIMDLITISEVFAAVGGLIGAGVASNRQGDSWQQFVGEALVGIIAASALADYLLPPNKYVFCMGFGVLVGIAVGHALDAVDALAPALMKNIIESAAGRYLGLKPPKKNIHKRKPPENDE